MSPHACQTRDSIEDIWGPRTPYKHQWPTRVDERCLEKPDKWVQSACVLCSNGCGLDIGVKDGKIVGVRGRAVDRVNHGRLGPKGLNGWESAYHADRLKYPLIRKNGRLERASWDEAMALVVGKTKEIVSRLTKHGVAFYTSGQLFLEEYYVLAMVGKAGLNTLHMDGSTRLCTATAAAALRESFGSDGQPGSYEDIDYTDCILLVGHNMAATQTVLWSRVLDRLEGPNPPKLIVVDPVQSDTAKKATVHLAPKVGTNLALLNGIEHLMFKNGWINDSFLSKHVVGLEELKETVEMYDPDTVEEITGVPETKLKQAAEIIGTAPSLLSTALQGVYQSNQATASACQINNINLLRGLIGKPGSGIFQMNGQPTAQNNREAGCDGEYPGFRNFKNPAHMQQLAELWNIDPIKVPSWNQPTHVENMLNYIDKGSIEMFWISCTNPLVSLPNLTRVRDVLTKPELFLVCQDIFPTETTAIADVVLPAAGWGEKTGCFTNVDRTVHFSHKAVDPPGEAKPDLDIWLDFGRRMGFKDKDGNDLLPWTKPEEVFEAWKRLSKGRPCDYSGLSYDKLTGGSGMQWPCNDEFPNGKPRLFDDGIFFTDTGYCESYGHDLETGAPYSKAEYQALNPAGRAILKACHYLPSMEEPDEEYPLRLSTGRRVFQFHTRTKTGRAPRLHDADPGALIRISEEDAERFNVKEGENVVARSRRGKVEMPVTIGGVAAGQAFIPWHFGYWDAKDDKSRAANELTMERWDPVSKQPMFKSGAITIEKCHDEAGEVKIHAKEQQSSALERVQRDKVEARGIEDASERKRRLELWLGETYEAICQLYIIYDEMIPQLTHDHEISTGLRTLRQITERARKRLEPEVTRLHEDKDRGQSVANSLRASLFPTDAERRHPYIVLETLQALHVFLSYIEGALVALTPASQAAWDQSFLDAVVFAQSCIHRMQAWIMQQLKSRSPQTLLVPSTYPK